MKARGNKTLRVLGIVLAVVALIGLVRFFGAMSAVNAGIFLCPGILAAVFLIMSRPAQER